MKYIYIKMTNNKTFSSSYSLYSWQFYRFPAVLVFQIDFNYRLSDQKTFKNKLHICSPGNYPSESAIIFWIKCLTGQQLNNSSLFLIHYLPAVQTKVPLESAGLTGQMAPYRKLWVVLESTYFICNISTVLHILNTVQGTKSQYSTIMIHWCFIVARFMRSLILFPQYWTSFNDLVVNIVKERIFWSISDPQPRFCFILCIIDQQFKV